MGERGLGGVSPEEPGGEPDGSDGAVSLRSAAQNCAILDQLLQVCCLELMADYALHAVLSTPVACSEPPIAVSVAALDFSGRDLRGTIGLRMTRSVVNETYRVALGTAVDPAPAATADWTCELVNQLIGRLKNKLRSYKVSFNVNSPRLLTTFPVAELERATRNRFVSDCGAFAGYLDVLIAPGFAFVNSPAEAPLVNEGDVVLF
jgi:hypothetical protein